jgi:predicted RND superfamily exporter protein
MWQNISNAILRNRWFILIVLLILTVFFGYFAVTGLKIDNKYGNMLPKDSPAQSNYLSFKEKFGEDGSALVIAIQTDSLFTKENFAKWKELGDSILQFDGVESVISEATLFTIHNNIGEQKFEAKKIFSDIRYSEKSIDSIKKEIRNNPLYQQMLYNDSSNVSLMMIGIDEEFLANQKKSKVVLEIEAVAESYGKYFGKMHYAGLPHIRVVIGKRVINEMYIFVGLAIFVTSLLLYIFFRSLRVVLICNTVVFVAVIWSMGTIGLFGFNISILMALIPPLMIVIGIPNCIFLMTKYHQEVKKHGNKMRAISRVIQKIGTATFLTNFTTALGFATFIFTNSQKLIEFGIIASINIMVVFILSLLIIPIFTSLSKNPKERHLHHLDRKFAQGFIEKLIYVTGNHRKAIYLVAIGVVAFSVFGIYQIKATGNLTGDLPKDDPILKDVLFIEENFGGSIPFEMMISYKEPGRLFKNETLEKIDSIQEVLKVDSLFSKSLSIVDMMKVINMAYYGNNPEQYKILSNKDKKRLKKYLDNFDLTDANAGSMSIKELVDTTSRTIRVRTQMKDIGSYEVADIVDSLKLKADRILNPEKKEIEVHFAKIEKGKKTYIDSILQKFPAVYNSLTAIISSGNSDLQFAFDSDFEKIKAYYSKSSFTKQLRKAIDQTYYDVTLTGTSVVASEGTQYLVNNLFTSLLFAILCISVLMAILFRSWRMVIISLIPNFIPLLFTGGIMGWFGIPLKPSTLLVFSIAFGISVDDTIHFLAKYRQELKHNKWDLKYCVAAALRETGLGMFYTSVVLFCGFSMFSFSQFGGTQALGLLVSMTLLVAMITNLVVLPSLLLTLDRLITTKSFQEPYFDVYDEEDDIEFDSLRVESENEDNTLNPIP